MKYTITGDNLQFVNCQLEQGEMIQSEAGRMVYMTGNAVMEAKMGGFWKGVKRMMNGASFMLVNYHSDDGACVVGFGGSVPGKILDIDVSQGSWLVQSSGYIASEMDVKLDLAFQKRLGSMLFGGEGLLLQRLTGTGKCFIGACGDFNVVDLKPGEVYKVSTAHAVAWQDSVNYDVSAAGGIKTSIFGGEGLFVTTLTGPGKIVIQSMSLGELAASLIPYMPKNTSS